MGYLKSLRAEKDRPKKNYHKQSGINIELCSLKIYVTTSVAAFPRVNTNFSVFWKKTKNKNKQTKQKQAQATRNRSHVEVRRDVGW